MSGPVVLPDTLFFETRLVLMKRFTCRAAREGVAIFDQSYFGKFFLTGADATAAVQYVMHRGRAVATVAEDRYPA